MCSEVLKSGSLEVRGLGIYFPGTQDDERRQAFATSCRDFPGDGGQLSGALRAGLAGAGDRQRSANTLPSARLCFLCKFLERGVGRRKGVSLETRMVLRFGSLS